MKQKKHTVNERILLLEKMCYKLALEVNAIVDAINKTAKDTDKPNTNKRPDTSNTIERI